MHTWSSSRCSRGSSRYTGAGETSDVSQEAADALHRYTCWSRGVTLARDRDNGDCLLGLQAYQAFSGKKLNASYRQCAESLIFGSANMHAKGRNTSSTRHKPMRRKRQDTWIKKEPTSASQPDPSVRSVYSPVIPLCRDGNKVKRGRI